MILNVDTGQVVVFANKLEKMGKTKLPIAIRQTLNSVAFEMKRNNLIETSNNKFVNRQPNFFRAMSRVEVAKGNDIRLMQSKVGFMEKGLKGQNNYAVKDLVQQEHGGKIGGKTFIPTKKARGGSMNALVTPQNRLSKIKKKRFIKTADMQGANQKEKFIKAAIKAKSNGYVLSDRFLYRINSLYSSLSDRNTYATSTVLYSVKKGRSVKVSRTKFMETAANEAASKMDVIFVNHAKKILFR